MIATFSLVEKFDYFQLVHDYMHVDRVKQAATKIAPFYKKFINSYHQKPTNSLTSKKIVFRNLIIRYSQCESYKFTRKTTDVFNY